MKNMNDVARKIAQLEGKKVQLDIGQIKEVLGIMCDLVCSDEAVQALMFRTAAKRKGLHEDEYHFDCKFVDIDGMPSFPATVLRMGKVPASSESEDRRNSKSKSGRKRRRSIYDGPS